MLHLLVMGITDSLVKKIENRKSEVSWWFELCVRLVTSTEIIVVHFFLANGASNGTNKNTEPKNLQN